MVRNKEQVLRDNGKLTNAAVFTTNKPSGNTATLDVFACIHGGVMIVIDLPGRFTCVKSAVERFDLSRPELEVASGTVTITREGNLRGSAGKHVQNFPVYNNCSGCEERGVAGGLTGNIAKLVVVKHCFAPFVTDHSL